MSKHTQHRPATRAPHGSPIYSERFSALLTPKQRAWIMRKGASGKVRSLIDSAMEQERAQRRAARQA